MRSINLGILRQHDFRMLFAASAVSAFGYGIGSVAIPLVAVISLNASAFEVGLLSATGSIAFLLIALPAGVWVDRMQRRRVLVVSNLVRSGTLLLIPFSWWIGLLTIWELYAISLVIGFCSVFYQIAIQGYIPSLVGRDNLMEANSKNTGIQHVATVASPALGGQLVAFLTAPVAIISMSASIAISGLLIGRIRKSEPVDSNSAAPKNWRKELLDGIQFTFRNRYLRPMTIAATWMGFWNALGSAVLVVFLARTLELTPQVMGLLLTCMPIGSILGAFMARRIASKFGQGRSMWLILMFGAPIKFLIPISGPDWRIWLLGFAIAVAAFVFVVFSVIEFSGLQSVTPDSKLGRVSGTARFLGYGVAPLGAIVGGSLGSAIGVRETLVLAAIGSCISFVPIFSSALRSVQTFPQHEPEDRDVNTPV